MKDLIFFLYIVGICRDHKEKQGISFDMTKETKSEAFAFTRPFDNTGNIRHDERTVIAIAHNTQIRFEGSKRIIGDLRFSSRYDRE